MIINFLDIPRPYQTFFQDTATPMTSGIIDLHQHVFFFVIIIFVLVMTQLYNIITFFKVSRFKLNARNYIKVTTSKEISFKNYYEIYNK